MSSLLERVTQLPLRRPPLTLAIAVALLVGSGVAISRLEFVSDLAKMLPTPAAKTLNRVSTLFGSGERAYLVLESEQEGREADLLRTAETLQTRLVGEAGIASVSWGPTVSSDDVLDRLLLPYGPVFVDPAELDSLEALFAREGMEAQLEAQASRLALLGLGEADVWAERDPLDLHRGLATRARSLGGGLRTAPGSPFFLSTSGRALLVIVESEKGTSTLAGARDVVAAIQRAVQATLAEPASRGLTVRATGGQFLAEESERIIRRDLIRSFSASIGLAILLLALCLRLRLHVVLLLCIPTLWGTGVGGGLFAVLRPSLAVLSLGCSAILIGLGVDFTVHLASAALAARADGLDAREATLRALRETRGALALAAFSSMAAFLAFLAADQQILRDMGLLTACGLLACLVGALGLLPVFLLVVKTGGKAQAPRDLGVGLACRLAAQRPWAVLAGAALLTALALACVASSPLEFEKDLRRLHAKGSEPLAAQDRIEEVFGGSQQSLVLLLEAADADAVVAACHSLEPLFSDLIRSGVLASRTSIAALLPSLSDQERCRAVLSARDPEAVEADLKGALDAVGFDPAAFSDYVSGVKRAVALDAPLTVATLESLGLGELTRRFVCSEGGRSYGVILLSPQGDLLSNTQRDKTVSRIRTSLAALKGATGAVSGLAILSSESSRLVEDAFSRVCLITVVLVLGGLFLRFRSPTTVVLVLLPAILGTLWTAGVFSLLDWRLNLMNLGTLPMVLAIGVDDGIHLIHRARRATEGSLAERLGGTAAAIMLTSLTTMVTFGSLALSENQGIASVGLLALVGVGGCLAATVLVLPAILSLRDPAEESP